jgi:heme/copper-type cytochrome/quinol oxidase subunit 2
MGISIRLFKLIAIMLVILLYGQSIALFSFAGKDKTRNAETISNFILATLLLVFAIFMSVKTYRALA